MTDRPIPRHPLPITRRTLWLPTWLLALCALVGCRGAPAPLPPLPPTATSPAPTFVYVTPEMASKAELMELIVAERSASIVGNLPLLATLWAEDARIVDGRDTPFPDDDLIWQGRAAILDRYTLAVLPAPPPPLERAALDSATLQMQPVTGYPTVAQVVNGGDRWQLVYRAGRWWLLELVYSSP